MATAPTACVQLKVLRSLSMTSIYGRRVTTGATRRSRPARDAPLRIAWQPSAAASSAWIGSAAPAALGSDCLRDERLPRAIHLQHMMPQGSFKLATHCVAKPAQAGVASTRLIGSGPSHASQRKLCAIFSAPGFPGQTPKLGGRVTRLCAAALSRKPHQRKVQPPATCPIYQRIALDGDGARDAAPE